MNISYSKNFIKQSKKLSPAIKEKLINRIYIFIENPLDVTLRNHALKGKFKEYRSIDITGDFRALYIQNGNEVIFDYVGSHSQIYG